MAEANWLKNTVWIIQKGEFHLLTKYVIQIWEQT